MGEPLSNRGLISIADLLNGSWSLFRSRLFSFLKITLFQLALTAVIGGLLASGLGLLFLTHNALFLWSYIVTIPLVLIAIYFIFRSQLALMYVPTTAADEKSLRKYISLTKGKVGPYFGVVFWQGLVVMGGSILLIVPGISIALASLFSPWVYLIEGKTGFAVIQQSRKYVYKRWWNIAGRKVLIALIMGAVGTSVQYLTSGSVTAYIILTIVFVFVSRGFTVCFDYLLYKSAAESCDPTFNPSLSYLKVLSGIAIGALVLIPLIFISLMFRAFTPL